MSERDIVPSRGSAATPFYRAYAGTQTSRRVFCSDVRDKIDKQNIGISIADTMLVFIFASSCCSISINGLSEEA